MSAFLKIKKRKDFIRAAKAGESVATTSLVLQAARSLSEEVVPPKFGFTTTKRLGHAVVRNRARRRLRAAVRELYLTEARDNIEYVLIGRYDTADCDFEILRRDLKYAFRKIHRLLEGKQDENCAQPSHQID